MRHHGTIFTALAVAAATALPGPAAASPLLSGYGGPGAGAQQIIGAGLVNGGGRRGGGPGAPSGGNSGFSGAGSASSAEPGGGGGAGSASGGSQRGGARSRGSSGVPGSRSSAHGAFARKARGLLPAGRAARPLVPSSTLGLSGAELLTALLIAAGLMLTAVSTLWLSHLKVNREHADRKHVNLGSSH